MISSPYIRKTLTIDLKNEYLFLEYFEGKDLYDFLNENTLTLQHKLKIFKDIVKGIDHMHSNFIAHLDFKLENIMINPITHKICIIDLGKSFVWKKNNQEYKLINAISSYEYMAPEEFKNNNSQTISQLCPDKIDIWSLGMILYCLVYEGFPWSQAHLTDKNFSAHLHFLKVNKLSPLLFPDINENSYTNENLLYLFKNTLCIQPSKRLNTKQILEVLRHMII
jgi:serine/threonine protein kinase